MKNIHDRDFTVSEDKCEFKDRLRLCIPKGMTQVEFAKFVGVSISGLQKWLSGASEPALPYIPKIARLKGVSITWLVANVGPKYQSEITEGTPLKYTESVPLNEALLIAVIEATETWIEKNSTNHHFSKQAKARAIRALYRREAKLLNESEVDGEVDSEAVERNVLNALSYLSEMEY